MLIKNNKSRKLFVSAAISLITACTFSKQPDSVRHGVIMNDVTNSETAHPGEHLIIVNDYGAKTQKLKPATDFPEAMRFFDTKVVIDGKEKILRVPVKEIKIRPLNSEGNLTEMKDAKVVSVQYIDGEGSVLQSTTMQKDK